MYSIQFRRLILEIILNQLIKNIFIVVFLKINLIRIFQIHFYPQLLILRIKNIRIIILINLILELEKYFLRFNHFNKIKILL